MALANMTHNVIDAVSYLRHTAGMIERLLASTEAIADEQVDEVDDTLDHKGGEAACPPLIRLSYVTGLLVKRRELCYEF